MELPVSDYNSYPASGNVFSLSVAQSVERVSQPESIVWSTPRGPRDLHSEREALRDVGILPVLIIWIAVPGAQKSSNIFSNLLLEIDAEPVGITIATSSCYVFLQRRIMDRRRE